MYPQNPSVKGIRVVAAIIDLIGVGMIIGIFNIIVSLTLLFGDKRTITSLSSINSHNLIINFISLLFSAIFYFLYYTVFPYLTKGRTIGKLLLGIKVVNLEYKEPSFFQLLIRNYILFLDLFKSSITLIFYIVFQTIISGIILNFLLFVISFFVYLVILIMILATQDERGLHDLIAGTYVVSKNFDIEQLYRVNALERTNMDWADFDDSYIRKDDKVPTNNDRDEIEILKKDM